MLSFKISKDKNFVILDDFTLNSERAHLAGFFSKKSKKADFNVMVDRGLWDGFDPFMSDEGEIGIGLWKEVYKFSDFYGYEVNIEGINSMLNLKFPRDKYDNYVNNLLDGVTDEEGDPITPRNYQSESAFRAIKYKFCTQELATSAGKTLIFYLFNSFLRDAKKVSSNRKALIIVPKAGLVTQTAAKFSEYLKEGKTPWKILMIGGKHKFTQKAFDECDLIISTYQSLNHWPEERFKCISALNIDEVHKSRGEVIQKIAKYCVNWEYKLGLSGTVKINEAYSDYYRMLETVGPLVLMLSAKHLIDRGFSPDIKIKQMNLTYNMSDHKLKDYLSLKATKGEDYGNKRDYGRDLLELEKAYIYQNEDRLEFISTLCKRITKNKLVLFSDIKNSYGKKLHEKLSKWNKKTYYIDGETDNDLRDEYKAIMENSDQITILTFVDSTVKINQYSMVPLTNGSYKLAKDIQKDDDVLDSWININHIR